MFAKSVNGAVTKSSRSYQQLTFLCKNVYKCIQISQVFAQNFCYINEALEEIFRDVDVVDCDGKKRAFVFVVRRLNVQVLIGVK